MTVTRQLVVDANGVTLQSAAQQANVVAHLAWREQNRGPVDELSTPTSLA